MNKHEALASLNSETGFFRHWMGRSQRMAIAQAIRDEEGQYFIDLLVNLKYVIENMPRTYETEKLQTKDKVVHLHYFRGSVDAWVVERDMGDSKYQAEIGPQHQAFGAITMINESIGDSEWGYFSIQELIENGIELDLHWTPKTVKEVK